MDEAPKDRHECDDFEGAEAMTSRFAVLGAGLMGRLMALSLKRLGYPVDLYDQGGPDGASSAAYAAAAMLSPLAESLDAEPLVVALGQASLRLWPGIIKTLPAPVFFQQEGTLVLWHPQDRDQAVQFDERLTRCQKTGMFDEPHRTLTAVEIETLEPQLGKRFSRALWLPLEGQLDNRMLLKALYSGLLEAGVEVHFETAMTPAAVTADWVIDCRGLGSKPDWSEIRGVRGEVLRVLSREVALTRPIRLLHPRYPLYIAPKPEGHYVVGATQIETEDTSPTSVRSALELLSALYSIHPAFGEARVLEMVSQCRPALPHHLPEIRWSGGRVIEINGLYRHGYLVAPAVLEAGLDLIKRLLDAPIGEDWQAQQPWSSIYHLKEAA